jgi:glycosyltransferase involved in cell wall biosynthesis
MKRLLLLADANSAHTRKWIDWIIAMGELEPAIFSLTIPFDSFYSDRNIKTFAQTDTTTTARNKNPLKKIKYFKNVSLLKQCIREFHPDIIHAHYATSYGMLGRKAGFHPYVISVWGSDIFLFPKKSIIHKNFLKKNLNSADLILATGKILAEKTKTYTNKPIKITPFGVNTNIFRPPVTEKNNEEIIIGTVKGIEYVYGIDILLKAFKIVTQKTDIKVRLVIAGNGTELTMMQDLAKKLNIDSRTEFLGAIPHKNVPQLLQSFHIFVALSRSESFGVAVIEASACGLPVVASDTGGLIEVINNGITGFNVPTDNIELAAEKLILLIENKELREKTGKAGREFVELNYSEELCKSKISEIYKL